MRDRTPGGSLAQREPRRQFKKYFGPVWRSITGKNFTAVIEAKNFPDIKRQTGKRPNVIPVLGQPGANQLTG